MKILSTYSIKGGVGKTATAVNLACLAAEEGYRTVLWDLDPQGAASFYYRIKPKVKGGVEKLTRGKRDLETVIKGTDFLNLDLVPADFSYRNMDLVFHDAKRPVAQLSRLLKPLREEYDLLIIDAAPSISLVSENIFLAADALLVPVIPTPLSVRTLEQLLGHLGKKNKGGSRCRVLPFFSMSDRRKALHTQVMRELPETYPDFLATDIPYSAVVEAMGAQRNPVTAFARNSRVDERYRALWDEVRAEVFKKLAADGRR